VPIADVVALVVECVRVTNLEETLEQRTVGGLLWIKCDVDGLGIGSVVAVGGASNVASG